MATARDFVAALERGDSLGAVAIAGALVATDAPLRDQWRGIAQFAAQAGEWSLAIAAIDKYRALAPDDVERGLFAADILATAGRAREASRLMIAHANRDPNDARVRHLLGTVLLELGETRAGLHQLGQAITLWPHSGISWLAIAGATNYRENDTAFAALERAEPAVQRAAPAAQAAYRYALAKALSDRGEHDAAFAAVAAGARLIRPERPYDRITDLAEARALIAGFSSGWLARARWTFPSDRGSPIFVTGIPRSGTTLVEQMLASHSRVGEGGELNLLGAAAAAIGGATATAARDRLARARGPAAAWEPLRARYHHLLDERVGQAGRALDKSLNLSRFAGLVPLALGDSPIVWLRRDPRDTAWSCYRTFFARGLGWSFDLADIGYHFAVEDLLFDHWRTVLGDAMLVVPYAALVADPDAWIDRILAHCGLEFEPAVRAFNATTRAVTTASVAQVRQPIYRHAIGSADVQSLALAPFDAAYNTARAELGLD